MNSKKHAASREDIVRKYDLPERQSKIDTLLKQDGQAYCICRSSDSSRFMIACDSCEEWYHGDCIDISEREAKNIKRFFCDSCRKDDPSLVTKYKSSGSDRPKLDVDRSQSNRSQVTHDEKKRKHKNHAKNVKRCGECVGCYQVENCGRCEGCKEMRKYGWSNKASKTKCKQRMCINTGQSGGKRHRRNSENERDRGPPPVDPKLLSSEPRQCYGPRCSKIARFGSKYCSDECGLNLATNRIYQVLPPRIQEWSLNPCIAEDKNKLALDKIRAQQQQVRRKLEELDLHSKQLDNIIERGKRQTIDPRADHQTSEDDTDTSMYCITCGHEIHNRTAIRHMEKCFNKFEAQASFGSVFKTRIEGNVLFCDYFNPSNRTYCKRLKVLCPEHCKDPKIRDDEVCGCPLTRNVFDQIGEYCRAAKKTCIKHYAWEKLHRAEIDIERVRQWLKIDELIEQERQIRHAMTNRAGVLALMLHSTYNHELMEKLAAAKDNDAKKELMRRFRNA